MQESMLSRIYLMLVIYTLTALRMCIRFLVGDVHMLAKLQYELVGLAKQAPDRTAKIRLGPALFPIRNIYHLLPATDPDIANKQLKTLMNLPEADSRSAYHFIPALTNSVFFLSMHDEQARPFRQRFVRHLDKSNILRQAEKAFPALLKNLEANQSSSTYNHDILSRHARDVLSQALTGFDYPEDILKRLKQFNPAIMNLGFIPDFVMRRLESYQSLQLVMHDFIGSQLRRKRESGDLQVDIENKQFVASIIISRFEHLKSYKDIDNAMIETLINDAELRSAVTSTMAFEFFTDALVNAFQNVFTQGNELGLLRDTHISRANVLLGEELKRLNIADELVDSNVYLNKEKMPVLHAIYLESLRSQAPLKIIPRYTHAGIQTDELHIPPRTTILFHLDEMLKQCAVMESNYILIPKDFDAERFLFQQKQLTEDAVLQKGFLTPFGVDRRACPAAFVVEALIKFYMIRLYQSTIRLDATDCILKRPATGDNLLANMGMFSQANKPQENPRNEKRFSGPFLL